MSLLSRLVPPEALRHDPTSTGICRMISSDEKMGSRYSHVACILSQLSIISCRLLSVFSHSTTLSRNGPMYLGVVLRRMASCGASMRRRNIREQKDRAQIMIFY